MKSAKLSRFYRAATRKYATRFHHCLKNPPDNIPAASGLELTRPTAGAIKSRNFISQNLNLVLYISRR
jgi:hypothetical protein